MYPIDTQDGLFHDGDGISELGTILPASWLNQVQQELIAVLDEAGIIPEKANTKQVVNAIKLIISNSTAKFATQASRLQTARNINGVPFDGTQNINATPAGAVQFFAMSTAPVGWLKANGAAVSRILYANLFAAIGTTFGEGDGKNTFNLPDLRGEFLRGWDDGRGVDSGRTLGMFQVDTVQRMTGEVGNITFNGDDYATGVFSRRLMSHIQIGTITPLTGNFKITFDSAAVARTSAETRPRNTALLACIKI
ncbi:Phage tail fiber protein [Snodgrassella communis]|nr:Phage tail fiber protein [Snodgrassella communis]